MRRRRLDDLAQRRGRRGGGGWTRIDKDKDDKADKASKRLLLLARDTGGCEHGRGETTGLVDKVQWGALYS
jgi:hypothetical protein